MRLLRCLAGSYWEFRGACILVDGASTVVATFYMLLCIVARDYQPLEVMAVDYYIDNTQLGFLVSDAEKNLILYMYQPEARESQGGHRLIRKADFHVGQVVSTMFRIK